MTANATPPCKPGTPGGAILVRLAGPEDVPVLLAMVRALAAFEGKPEAVRARESDLLRDGFGARPCFEALIAERQAEAVGFALFYPTYSTWAGRPGLFIDDLYVVEGARRLGVGQALVTGVARIALARGCARLELNVLHWNPARRFYERLGLAHMDEWLPYRAEGDALARLAGQELARKGLARRGLGRQGNDGDV